MGYYWYNFMPLSRGSAAVGTVAVQGLMLAAGFDVAAPIPPGVQPDWEARPRRAPILYPCTLAASSSLSWPLVLWLLAHRPSILSRR